MFVGMGISAVVPVLDELRTFGREDMERQIGLSWLVLQGALYILGAGLYAVSVASVGNEDRHLHELGRPESQRHGTLARLTSWEAHIKSFTS